MSRDIPIAIIIILAGFLFQYWFNFNDIVYLPFPIIVSIWATWNMAKPEYLLLLVAIIGEVLTNQKFGAITTVVFLPYAVRIFELIDPDSKTVKDIIIFLMVTLLQVFLLSAQQIVTAPAIISYLLVVWLACVVVSRFGNYFFNFND